MSERAWILLPSGKQLDLLDPDPWAWTDDDLAIGLSYTTVSHCAVRRSRATRSFLRHPQAHRP